ncbi:hypothetical protein B0H16DRAFT_1454366 [Mycena metata]|uniref:BZIP domain-containing protein n=1 Tax=Mycena metata TaxID=1033252 RepID=A0AAD7JHU0_9AGAR|nr:hypothetical protein B0H16DRAFT_1454366 [Mycena metata]
MPPAPAQRCVDDEDRCLSRLATYRKYRRTHLEERRRKGRERMARLRANQTDAQQERNREAQRRYRERYREQIAHRARRASVRKNAAAGEDTKLRPKARQYWSDPELASSESEEEDGECTLGRRLLGPPLFSTALLPFALARCLGDAGDAVPFGVVEIGLRAVTSPSAGGAGPAILRLQHVPYCARLAQSLGAATPSGINGPVDEPRGVEVDGRRAGEGVKGCRWVPCLEPLSETPNVIGSAAPAGNGLRCS